MSDSIYISIAEAAEIIGCSNETVINLLKRGALRGNDPENMRRAYVDRESVNVFCTAIPDYSTQILEIAALKKELKASKEELEIEKAKVESGMVKCIVDLDREQRMISDKFMDAVAGWVMPSRTAGILKAALQGVPMSEICKEFGLSKERCRQLIQKGLRQIWRSKLNYDTICDLVKYYPLIQDMKNREKHNIPSCATIDSDDSLISTERFSPMCCMRLQADEIYTVKQLLATPRSEFLKFRNIGRRSMAEIDAFVKSLGDDIYKNWA